ncbi:MAG: RNA polymerase sigma-70 factor [Chitinophagaceae bacterium]
MLTTAPYDERAMLAMVASGDRAAFTKLYSAHLPHLYRYVFLITKSKEETEEILQEIFIKIWENRDKLDRIESLQDYLFRMARNKLLDNVRHLQIRHKVLAEIKRTKDADASTTSDHCAYREYYQIVQQAIDRLPAKRKLIFRLNIENGLSQDEIALQLNISKSVVKKQLYSASRFVRQYLGEHSEMSVPVMLAVFLHTIQ